MSSLILFLLSMFLLMGTARVPAVAAENEPGKAGRQFSVEEIEEIIRDYLMRNPKVIADAMTHYNEQQKKAALERVRRTVSKRRQEIFHDSDSPVSGNPNGDVAIVEFFDYQCAYCRNVASRLVEVTNQDPNVRIVYKELPILGPTSVIAAKAALAARTMGNYSSFHHALMATKRPLTEEGIFKIAESVGLARDSLKKAMGAAEIEKIIERNRRLAQELEISGTPTFIIGDAVIRGAISLEALKQYVAAAREKQEPK
ncbi:MAG: DsbA family protein [Deltaproteobacteria bacterium]|nr:DsbA family protein [Deltaproteobacteria bacterium]